MRHRNVPAVTEAAIVVTGGSGQVGRCVLRKLRGAGQRCIALSHRRPIADGGPLLQVVSGDLTTPGFRMPSAKAEALIHTAALWLLPDRLEAFRALGVRRVVCFGSTSIVGKRGTRASDEQRLIERLEKAEHDIVRTCRELAVGCTIFRPTMIYGMGTDANVSRAARFIERFGFYPVVVGARGLRQPVHAEDLAGAALAALATPGTTGRRYDLGGGEVLSYSALVGRIFDALGRTRRIVPVPGLSVAVGLAAAIGPLQTTGDMVRRMRRDLVCDNGPAAADFGFTPRPFLSGGARDLFGPDASGRIAGD